MHSFGTVIFFSCVKKKINKKNYLAMMFTDFPEYPPPLSKCNDLERWMNILRLVGFMANVAMMVLLIVIAVQTDPPTSGLPLYQQLFKEFVLVGCLIFSGVVVGFCIFAYYPATRDLWEATPLAKTAVFDFMKGAQSRLSEVARNRGYPRAKARYDATRETYKMSVYRDDIKVSREYSIPRTFVF